MNKVVSVNKALPFDDGNVNWKPLTNADSIRAMSDEELAAWYCHDRDCRGCEFGASDGCHILDWLKAPVEEGDK